MSSIATNILRIEEAFSMTTAFAKAASPVPVDFSAVEAHWRRAGFSFGIFRDPPGQEWNDFTHRSDEYILVAEGQLKISLESKTAPGGGLPK